VYTWCVEKTHQVPDQWGSGVKSCTEVGGAVAQQEALNDTPRDFGDSKRDCRSPKDSEVVQKGAGMVGNSSHAGRYCGGTSVVA